MITKQFLQPLINGLSLTPGITEFDYEFSNKGYWYRKSDRFQVAYSLYGDLVSMRYSQYHLPYYFALEYSFKEIQPPTYLLDDKEAYRAFWSVCEGILSKNQRHSDLAKYSLLIDKIWPNDEELKSHIKLCKLGKIKYGEVDRCY